MSMWRLIAAMPGPSSWEMCSKRHVQKGDMTAEPAKKGRAGIKLFSVCCSTIIISKYKLIDLETGMSTLAAPWFCILVPMQKGKHSLWEK